MGVQAIMFGGIGTLVETSEIQRDAFNRAFAETGLGWHWPQDEYRHLLGVAGGRNRIRAYDRALDNGDTLSEELIAELHRRKTELFQDALANTRLEPRPGVIRLLNKARNHDVLLAIASTTSADNIAALAGASDLDLDAFHVILHAGSVARRKPAPDVYLSCLEYLDVPAAHAIAIEDSDSGLAAAGAAGVRCVAIPGENTAAQDFSNASLVSGSLADVDMLPGSGPFAPRNTGLDPVSAHELVTAIR
ncbi:MAG: HAD-IA family hydrolase [Woeseiaceae bacterium]|nr:HAD-IA family hydrolase [Woeseiaceae bacterium]